MDSRSDQDLLREYSEQGAESAFAELVRRRVDFVFSAAVRITGERHLAEDVAQSVFVLLARDAATLTKHPVILGWLHRTTRNLAVKTVRTEARRRAREGEVAMNFNDDQADAAWETIASSVDAALEELKDEERDVLLLRFFERRSPQEIATVLGTTEVAARKRVSRAVERLREIFVPRGVTVSAGALTAAMMTNSVKAAPAALAARICSTIPAVSVLSTSVTTAAKIIAMTTLQKTTIAIATIAAIGAISYEVTQNSSLRSQNETLQKQFSPLADEIRLLKKDHDDALSKMETLRAENERLKRDLAKLPKLRGEIAQLKKQNAAGNDPNDAEHKDMQERVAKIKQCLLERPEAKIPELQFLKEENYWDAVHIRPLDCEEAYLMALSNLRSSAEFSFITDFLNPALHEYSKAYNGQFPTDLAQLRPYFPSPVDDAILARWEVAPASAAQPANYGDPIITLKAAVDADWDARYVVGLTNFGSTGVDTAGHNGWGITKPERVLGQSLTDALTAFEAA
ncbi:MAG: hypothetical protein JWO95_805, partial [Verrucomicrobiales bacterium]|nr:hypothetical protein [Verrucomicrobiales bacterium]